MPARPRVTPPKLTPVEFGVSAARPELSEARCPKCSVASSMPLIQRNVPPSDRLTLSVTASATLGETSTLVAKPSAVALSST